MKTVWKFPLIVTDRQTINVPKGAKPLHVDVQLGVLTVWYLVDPDAKQVLRRLRIVGTGHTIDYFDADNLKYVGSAMMAGGRLVWHVFDGGEE